MALLAHHRFLRTPNRQEFQKALKRVLEVSKDTKITDRAKRYITGL